MCACGGKRVGVCACGGRREVCVHVWEGGGGSVCVCVGEGGGGRIQEVADDVRVLHVSSLVLVHVLQHVVDLHDNLGRSGNMCNTALFTKHM